MKNVIDILTLAVATIAMAVAATTDYRTRKVPNALTFPCMAAGLAMTAAWSPKEAGIRALWALGVAFTSVFGMMGMGDVKLIMAVVALRGASEAIWCVFFGAAAMIAYCFATDRGNMTATLKDTFAFVTVGTPLPRRSDVAYPFATFMAVGYPLAWFVARA